MKEIGSFIELGLKSGKEYYSESHYGLNNIVRLNTARAAIYHSLRCFEVNKVWLPIYECDTVSKFLEKKNVEISYYYIDDNFIPMIHSNDTTSAIVFPNYFGIMSKEHFMSFVSNFHNVIIDNAQAFFSEPIENCINVYSCRKFVGTPDGAYVIGKNVNRFMDEYELDYSSDTALFLLLRHEYGCSGKAYTNRKLNEDRIDKSDIKKMSILTRKLLDSADYSENIDIRKNNFQYARKIFDKINEIQIDNLTDDKCIPMVYPLLVHKDLIKEFHENKIFQGHWWEYIVNIAAPNSFEHRLASYILPITIDSRYGIEEIDFQYSIVMEGIKK